MRINGISSGDESIVDDEILLAEREKELRHAQAERRSLKHSAGRGSSISSAVDEARMRRSFPPLVAGRTYLARFHRQVRCMRVA
jgi:hypothetical protein